MNYPEFPAPQPVPLAVALAQYSAVLNQTTFTQIQPGTVLELTAQGRTRNGLFREPAFLKVRTDKPQTESTL